MRSGTWPSLAIVALAAALATVRDFLFVNLNSELHFRQHRKALNYAHSQFKAWAQAWSTTELCSLKWVLAFCFIGFNLLLAIALARVRFGDHRYRMAVILGFVLLGAAAFSAQLVSPYLTGFGTLATKLLHALQYPVLLLVIWAASWIPRR